jgi:hypothetical protein
VKASAVFSRAKATRTGGEQHHSHVNRKALGSPSFSETQPQAPGSESQLLIPP